MFIVEFVYLRFGILGIYILMINCLICLIVIGSVLLNFLFINFFCEVFVFVVIYNFFLGIFLMVKGRIIIIRYGSNIVESDNGKEEKLFR